MLLSLLYGIVLIGVGVCIGVSLSERKIVTVQDLKACASSLIERGRKLTSKPENTQTKTQ